jgi:Uma2 family endonuclease
MSSVLSTPSVPVPKRQSPPLLVNGDRLSREEFERRYTAMRRVKKAELIEGVVYMPSPVNHQWHGKPHSILNALLVYYVSKTPGLSEFGDNGTVRLDNDNEPQPDLYILLPTHAGSRAKVDNDGYISGAPALVCEIAASSVSIDLHLKKTAYRRNGVQEYLVWRTEDQVIDWFLLVAGEFVPIAPESDGTLRSRIFPGLWLHPATIFSADLPAIFALLDRGTDHPDHADFVKLLAGGAQERS